MPCPNLPLAGTYQFSEHLYYPFIILESSIQRNSANITDHLLCGLHPWEALGSKMDAYLSLHRTYTLTKGEHAFFFFFFNDKSQFLI